MRTNMLRTLLFVAGWAILTGVVPHCTWAADPSDDEERLNIESITSLEAQGGFVRLEGQSLFFTSDLKKNPRPGHWLQLSSDPRAPSLVCRSLPCGWDMALAGDYAVLCDYTKVLSVYDTRDGQWRQATQLEMPSMTENIIIRGKLAYVANHVAGLTTVDISSPAKPSIVSEFNAHIDCDAIGLWRDSAILYGHWESRLVLVDISDPAAPRQTGVYQHTAKSFNQGELAVDNGLAYCTTVSGVVIVNIADPADPTLVKAIDIEGRITDIAVKDGYAFVAAGTNGVRAFDVSDPNNPQELGYYKSRNKLVASQVAVKRDAGSSDYYLYVASRQGPARILRFQAPPASDATE